MMGVEDLLKMKPRELQIYVATKVMQIHEEELPEIKERLKTGDKKFEDHERRLLEIEMEKKIRASLGINGYSRRKKVIIAVGGGGGLTAVVVSAIVGGGRVLGWW